MSAPSDPTFALWGLLLGAAAAWTLLGRWLRRLSLHQWLGLGLMVLSAVIAVGALWLLWIAVAILAGA